MTITHHFTGPKVKAERKGACPGCGKSAKRTRTFERTVNPFNKHADGTPKTWPEVHADVKAEADAWDPPAELFECAPCEQERTKPEPGPVEPFPEAALIDAADRRAARRRWLDWVDAAGLPLADLHWHPFGDGGSLHVRAREVVALARALGVETVESRHAEGDLAVEFKATPVHGVVVKVDAQIDANGRTRPPRGDLSVDDLDAFITETGATQYRAAVAS